jgi:hypothetical protein
MRRVLAIVALAQAIGCAGRQSPRELLAARRYPEALCAIDAPDVGDADRRAVRDAIRRAVQPRVRARVLDDTELATILGSAPPQSFTNGAAVVLITIDTTAAFPNGYIDASADLLRVVVPAQVSSVDELASLLGEKMPNMDPRTVQVEGMNPLLALGAWLATGGAVTLPVESRTVTSIPSQADIRAAAPRTARLGAWAREIETLENHLGATCQTARIVRRTAAEASVQMRLTVAMGFTVTSCDHLPAFDPTTNLTERAVFDVPPGPTLRARLASLFGDRGVPLP